MAASLDYSEKDGDVLSTASCVNANGHQRRSSLHMEQLVNMVDRMWTGNPYTLAAGLLSQVGLVLDDADVPVPHALSGTNNKFPLVINGRSRVPGGSALNKELPEPSEIGQTRDAILTSAAVTRCSQPRPSTPTPPYVKNRPQMPKLPSRFQPKRACVSTTIQQMEICFQNDASVANEKELRTSDTPCGRSARKRVGNKMTSPIDSQAVRRKKSTLGLYQTINVNCPALKRFDDYLYKGAGVLSKMVRSIHVGRIGKLVHYLCRETHTPIPSDVDYELFRRHEMVLRYYDALTQDVGQRGSTTKHEMETLLFFINHMKGLEQLDVQTHAPLHHSLQLLTSSAMTRIRSAKRLIRRENLDTRYERNQKGLGLTLEQCQEVLTNQDVLDYLESLEKKASEWGHGAIKTREYNAYAGYIAAILCLRYGKRPSVPGNMRVSEVKAAKKLTVNGVERYRILVKDHKTSIINGPDVVVLFAHEYRRFDFFLNSIRPRFEDERPPAVIHDTFLLRNKTNGFRMRISAMIHKLQVRFKLPVILSNDVRKCLETAAADVHLNSPDVRHRIATALSHSDQIVARHYAFSATKAALQIADDIVRLADATSATETNAMSAEGENITSYLPLLSSNSLRETPIKMGEINQRSLKLGRCLSLDDTSLDTEWTPVESLAPFITVSSCPTTTSPDYTTTNASLFLSEGPALSRPSHSSSVSAEPASVNGGATLVEAQTLSSSTVTAYPSGVRPIPEVRPHFKILKILGGMKNGIPVVNLKRL